MEFIHAGGELHEFFGAFDVLQEHEGLEGFLEPVAFVVARLVGAEHQVHLAVFHLQPCEFAAVVVVGLQGIDLGEQILPH